MLSLMMLIYVTILIILMLFSKQARGRSTWCLRATWCPRAPCWWPLARQRFCTSVFKTKEFMADFIAGKPRCSV